MQYIGVILFIFSLPGKRPFLNHLPEPSIVHDTKNITDKNLMNELGELLICPKYTSVIKASIAFEAGTVPCYKEKIILSLIKKYCYSPRNSLGGFL